MPKPRQLLSILLSVACAVNPLFLDGCSKKSQSSPPGQQPPATTYAIPTADQLYQLVAPIALFPDNLLAQVLAASTYPDQISAAYQWLQQNSRLKGQQLLQTVDQQSWDASVKGLTQFPDVLQQMATNLSWTSALGDAYYNVPQSVMNAVQVMRQRAYQAGNLKTNQQQAVAVQNRPAGGASAPASSGQKQVTVVQSPPQTIVIQPAQPDVVYVPTYNPTVVYGAPVPAYPGYSAGEMAATSLLSFGVGIAVGAAINGGGGCCGWGWNSWGCGWHNSTVVYNNNTFISNSNTFANRNNYYNRNFSSTNLNPGNINNWNRNNVNNLNRNNYNANNFNRGTVNNASYRANEPNRQFTTPQFNQQRNQQQFRNQGQGDLAQQRGASQPNFNPQNRPGYQQQSRNSNQQFQPRSNSNFSQNQRQPERGYGQQESRGSGTPAFSNYGPGGNTRANSARGQQSLEARNDTGFGGRRSAGGGGFGGRSAGGGGGRRR